MATTETLFRQKTGLRVNLRHMFPRTTSRQWPEKDDGAVGPSAGLAAGAVTVSAAAARCSDIANEVVKCNLEGI